MAQKAGYSSLGSERPTAATSAPPGPDEGPVASTSSGAVHENTGKRVDRYLYASYAFLGCGILFPWNAIITATDFFYALYPAQHVDRLFPIAYFFPNVAVLLLLNLFPDTCRGVLSQRSRVLAGYSSFLFALLTITVAGGPAPDRPLAARRRPWPSSWPLSGWSGPPTAWPRAPSLPRSDACPRPTLRR